MQIHVNTHTCIYALYMYIILIHTHALKRHDHLYHLPQSLFILAGSCLYRKRVFFHYEALHSFATPFQNNCMEHDGGKLSQPAVKKIRLKNKLKAYPITSKTMTFFKTGLSCPQGNFSGFLFNSFFRGNFVEFFKV